MKLCSFTLDEDTIKKLNEMESNSFVKTNKSRIIRELVEVAYKQFTKRQQREPADAAA